MNSLKRLAKKILGISDSCFRTQLEDWLKTIDVKAKTVLDIGGGLKPVHSRTKSFEVKKYMVLDNNLEGNFHPDFYADLNNLSEKATKKLKGLSFEVIFCLEVMEYIYNPLSTLKFIYNLLEKSGVLYISFPSIYPPHEPIKNDYLRYTKQGIIMLLKKSGFSKIKVFPRVATHGKKDLKSFYKKEKMKGVNKDVIFDIGYMVIAYK